MLQRNRIFVYLGILVTMFFWSYSFLWYKDVYRYLTPFTTIFFRLLISSVFLLVISISIGRLEHIHKKDITSFLLLGFFEPVLYFIGESQGIKLITPTTASVIVSIIPLLMPFLAFLFLKEKVSFKNVIGILLSFLGVSLVIMNGKFEFQASGLGVFFMCLSVIAAIFYAVMLRKLAAKYNPFTLITAQNIIGVVMFLPLVIIFDVPSWHAGMVTVKAMIPVIKLAIFASSIAFIFYTYAIRMLGTVKTNVFANLIPVITAILSYFILGERLLKQNVIGIFLVIIGLTISQVYPLRKIGSIMNRMSQKDKKINSSSEMDVIHETENAVF